MPSSSPLPLVLLIAGGCVCFMAVAVIMFFVFRSGTGGTGSDDPFQGLPKEPPPGLPNSYKDLWNKKSNCWHMNHFFRVEAVDFWKTSMVDALEYFSDPSKLSKTTEFLTKEVRELNDLTLAAIQKCPDTMYVEDENGNRTTKATMLSKALALKNMLKPKQT